VQQVNIHEAKTHFSKLVERVEAGDEIVIARAGKPVAKLVPVEPQREPRKLGQLKGKIWVSDDWDSDEVNQEIARLFYGGELPETLAG
jgi:prevent-host-death family protein